MLDQIIGSCEKVRQLKNKIIKICDTETTVLIYGETGTGKDLVARTIHEMSLRKGGPYLPKNCAAVPDSLFESIFFGTKRGSYTGAEDRTGIFEAGNHGTIFLDEINSMSMAGQSKLLRVIENKKITRVGDTIARPIDVRIIAALNRDPQSCIDGNEIRPDFYYRLAGVQLNIPPLRERKEDIPELIDYFIMKFNNQMGKTITSISPEVFDIFMRHRWPGNIRELKNVLETAFNFAKDNEIRMDDLPEYILEEVQTHDAAIPYASTHNMSLRDYMNLCEKKFLEDKISKSTTLAALANEIGISKQTLNYKLHKYGIKKN